MRPPFRRPSVRLAAVFAGAGALCAVLAGCGGAAGPAPRTADEAPAGLRLELLGVAELGKTTPVDAAPVGGLSALAWQPSSGRWLALSDDRGDFGPPRLYALAVDLADGRLEDGDVEVVGATPLAEADGAPLAARSADPEGLALSPHGTLWISSEGDADRDAPPWLRELGTDGVTRRVILPPAHFLPAGPPDDRRGVRFNYGFEALAIAPDGRRLITAGEVALAQDGPVVGFGQSSRARLLVVDAASGRPLAEHVYEVDPLPAPADEGGLEVGGLVELLALGDGRLLALERTFATGRGNSVRLYAVDLAGADRVTGAPRLPRRARPVEKRLFLDFARLDVPLDNVEGMALGPALPDGRRTLVLVSDDNFSAGQRTLFYAFALSGAAVPPVPAAPPPARATIPEVQGVAHLSPLAGREVAGVEGVVTAVAAPVESGGRITLPGGFWMEDPAGDGDPATADGLWVSESGGPGRYPVAAGDRVRASGRVAEVGRRGEECRRRQLAGPA
ncbi:MAG TPA: esterase-like activity of phytase family protein, partial [Thermoanaerobaculia bacterium]|nr:esterase-like activity of phytase family protein [Thermoanaerobaculia bacterium]